MTIRRTATKRSRTFPRAGSPREQQFSLAQEILRHYIWASGVLEKFRRQPSKAGGRPQGFIYVGTQRWFALSHTWQKFMSGQQRLELRLAVNNVFPRQTIIASGKTFPAEKQGQPARLLPYRGTTVSFVPSWYPVEKWRVHSTPQVDSGLRPAPSLNYHTGDTLPPVLALRSVNLHSRNGQNTAITETTFTQLGPRIHRKLQRVESGPTYHTEESDSWVSRTSPRRDFIVESQAPRVLNRSAVTTGSDHAPAANPAPALQMGEIADEVMRQLDRRLIATRERIGKM
jgi:hypothetical protein